MFKGMFGKKKDGDRKEETPAAGVSPNADLAAMAEALAPADEPATSSPLTDHAEETPDLQGRYRDIRNATDKIMHEEHASENNDVPAAKRDHEREMGAEAE